jgi:uncharacterized glyoxalase superfamily protein PhnB
MKPLPKNWPRISSALFYDDPARAIDWICHAFGFELRLKVEGENGSIEHSELTFGEGLIMVGTSHKTSHRAERTWCVSPRSTAGGGNTQALHIYVDDVEAHCARARAAGARIVTEPKTSDYGPEYWSDRSYEAEDLEGHHWWFSQRLRDQK